MLCLALLTTNFDEEIFQILKTQSLENVSCEKTKSFKNNYNNLLPSSKPFHLIH